MICSPCVCGDYTTTLLIYYVLSCDAFRQRRHWETPALYRASEEYSQAILAKVQYKHTHARTHMHTHIHTLPHLYAPMKWYMTHPSTHPSICVNRVCWRTTSTPLKWSSQVGLIWSRNNVPYATQHVFDINCICIYFLINILLSLLGLFPNVCNLIHDNNTSELYC